MFATVHVVGAGLAGLSSALRLVRGGRKVVVHEAAGFAGGRCRSFFDAALGRRIDNGNHLVLSGNRAVRAYLHEIGSDDALAGPARAEFPFLDIETGERWAVRPGSGRIPWWLFSKAGRVPGTGLGEYLRGLRLARAGDRTVAQCLDGPGRLYEKFWEPLALGVLNTGAHEAAASLLRPVLAETFGRGEAACRPRIAKIGLSESFIDPALACLEREGAEIRFNDRLRSLNWGGDKVEGLVFCDGVEEIAGESPIVLAVPPAAAARLVPGLDVPDQDRPIVNVHFRLDKETEGVSILGLVKARAQWLFLRDGVASVTVSAAHALACEPGEAIAEKIWMEVAKVLDMGGASLPPYRVVKEKRATFAQTPDQVRRRPATRTRWANLFLAGDWTDTGLPATIEGSIRSGFKAAEAVLAVKRP